MGKVNKYWLPAGDGTATFVGDIVKLDGTADLDGYPSVIQAAAGNTPVGVIVWMEPNPLDLSQNYRPASQNLANQNSGRWVYVCDDPGVIMEVQGSGTATITSIGSNVDMVVGAGSTTTGQSGMQIDFTTDANTSTLVFRIMGSVKRPDNDPTIANAKWLVGFNVHQYGSVGVTGTTV